MENMNVLKNTASPPRSNGEVKVILEGNSTLQPSVVRSLEIDTNKTETKTKNPEQLTLAQKKKTRRRNRAKKPIVLQNSTLVQEFSEIESLYSERNTNAEVNSSGVLNNTSFPRLPFSRCRKKLLILDINGLLADIVSPPPKVHKADTKIARRASEN